MSMARTGDATAGPFGATLRRQRITAGLSQQELAERAGLSVAAVAALERGRRRRPHPGTVRSLAAALGLPVEARAELLEAAAGAREAPAGLAAERPRLTSIPAELPACGVLPAGS